MTPHPVIGIVTQSQEPQPGQVTRTWGVGQRYVRALADQGALPWLVPLFSDEGMLHALYDWLDGIVLTGGVDVDPALYHEPRHELCQAPDSDRDRVEMQLVRWAVRDGKPLFGICRGIQTLNVALGGTLFQDLDGMRPGRIKHDCFAVPGGPYGRDHLAHDVRVTAGSRLGRALGTERLLVNSLHHQGIKELAPGLTATAWAPDGLIEGVEGSGDAILVGVQWHPEDLTETRPEMRRLFAAFVEATWARKMNDQ